MKQYENVTRKSYTSPITAIVKFAADDAVRTSGAQEVGVAWNTGWNDAWSEWENSRVGG